MVRLRAAKVEAIGQDVPDVVYRPGDSPMATCWIIGWGSTFGNKSDHAALKTQRAAGIIALATFTCAI